MTDANLPTGETMSEGTELPPLPEAPGGAGEIAVPLAALAQPDDQERMNTPTEGDSVTLTVEATVTRIAGEQAFIRATSVNGQDVAGQAPAEPDGDEGEGAALRGLAEQMAP